MKIKLIILALLISAKLAMAIITVPFPGWDWLKENSTDIIVVRCVKAPTNLNARYEYHSEIDGAMLLKGTNGLHSGVLRSFYLPQDMQYYLIFSCYHDGSYQAIEAYRIVPLGMDFYTNSIAGKPLDEQLQILFKHRIENLDRQMNEEQSERNRLEEALKK